LLDRDFATGEQFLAEYEELCKVPIPTGVPNVELRALEAEGQRRRAKLAFLTAHGREEQGKILPALRGYLDYAALASNEDLISIPGEPSLKAPRSTWLAGHIPSLLERATPEDRKALEEEINRKAKALR
jgi:hypothetical protein